MNNKIWMDLELREDVDDYITLIYALENNVNISVLSINNPSVKELKLFNYALSLFNKNIPVVVSGEISVYDEGKDICAYAEDLIKGVDVVDYFLLEDFKITNELMKDTIVFCGGSLTTLAYLTENVDNDLFKACIQGGFASYEVVGIENTLKKFKKRKAVPSWNLNLDFESTKIVLESSIDKSFISKNICHNSFVDIKNISKDTVYGNSLKTFLSGNKYSNKCIHDLLAFVSIFDNDIVTFANVDLKYDDTERVKWWSEMNDNSTTRISVLFDTAAFLDLF